MAAKANATGDHDVFDDMCYVDGELFQWDADLTAKAAIRALVAERGK